MCTVYSGFDCNLRRMWWGVYVLCIIHIVLYMYILGCTFLRRRFNRPLIVILQYKYDTCTYEYILFVVHTSYKYVQYIHTYLHTFVYSSQVYFKAVWCLPTFISYVHTTQYISYVSHRQRCFRPTSVQDISDLVRSLTGLCIVEYKYRTDTRTLFLSSHM